MARVRSGLGLGATSLIVLAVGFLLGTQVIAQSGKQLSNPEAGLSDAQREAIHRAAHDRNDQFLRDFVAQHSDPHSLPVAKVESYGATPMTLVAALAMTNLIVEGRVSRVDFAINPSGGLPLATATVDVIAAIRGQGPETLTVFQLGGPVATATGGALAELDADALILPDDHVILLLVADNPSGSYRTVPGSGVMLVSADGTVAMEEASPFAAQVNSRSLEAVAALLSGK